MSRTAATVTGPLLALALLGGLTGCGGDQDPGAAPSAESSAPAPSSPAPGSPQSPDPSDPSDPPGTPEIPSGEATEPNPSSEACDEVVAGIDDFNTGDLEGTVGHFEDALPLARAEAREARSEQARLLLEAVRYYADLAPEDYAEASRTSPDFQRYKAITLGQCVSLGEVPGGPEDDGVEI